MERIKEILKGIWALCSFVFVVQRRPKGEIKLDDINCRDIRELIRIILR